MSYVNPFSFPATMKTILPRLTQDNRVAPPRGTKNEALVRRLQQRTMDAHLADWIGRWPSTQHAWEALTIPCDLVHWVRHTHELHNNDRPPLGSFTHRLLTGLCVVGVRTQIHLAYDPEPFAEKLGLVDAWTRGAHLDPAQIEREIYELLNTPHPARGEPFTPRRTQGECVAYAVRHAATCAKGCYSDAELCLRLVDGSTPQPTMMVLLRRLAPSPPPFFVER